MTIGKVAVDKDTELIAANCNNVLDFLQAITVKAPRVAAAHPVYAHTQARNRMVKKMFFP